MRALVECRIKPYYLHHADLAPGTAHLRTTIAEGQALMRKLHGHMSGLCQPTYVLDIPGGFGKSPIGPSYLSDGLQSDRGLQWPKAHLCGGLLQRRKEDRGLELVAHASHDHVWRTQRSLRCSDQFGASSQSLHCGHLFLL